MASRVGGHSASRDAAGRMGERLSGFTPYHALA
jgi:hypothetical protein